MVREPERIHGTKHRTRRASQENLRRILLREMRQAAKIGPTRVVCRNAEKH